MKRLLLMSILITATAAMSLQAELVITESTTRGGKNPQTDTLYAAPDKVAIVEPGTGGFIYLDKSKRLIEYSTTKGTYFEFTADTMKKLKAKTDKIIQDAKARMEKQLKSMPKDQQAMMQQAIDQMGRPRKYTYKRLGPKVTVGKWSCVPVEQYVDGEENQK
ncbi:hypothetical protein, partial [Salinispira pacifica]